MIGAEDIARSDRIDPGRLAGVEIVRAFADGRLPRRPMAETLPFPLLPPSMGRVELRAVPQTRFLNPMGTVHVGWAMTMLDSAMGLSAT
jgi:acyl-coenzyme A thioesterase PaaI-like protein